MVLTLPQVADLAGVEYRTLHTWLKRGLLAPTIQTSSGTGRPNLFAVEDAVGARVLADLRRAGAPFSVLAEAGALLRAHPESLRREAFVLVRDRVDIVFEASEALGSLRRGGATLVYNTSDALREVTAHHTAPHAPRDTAVAAA